MSSISSSDRSRHTDELRRTREEYENREAEGVKKQKKELRRVQEKHSQEVQDITDNYEGRIDAVQAKSRETITKRDEAHREQVDQIRNMYREQLRRKTEDNESNSKVLRQTLNAEMNKQEAIKDQQRSELERNFRDALNERDAQFAEHSERSRTQIKDSLVDRTDKLNQKHDREVEALAQDRDRKIFDMQKNQGDQKSHYEARLRDQERRARSDRERVDSNWRSIVEDQAAINSTVLENRNQLLKAERDALREDFRVRADGEALKNDQIRDNIKAEVGERLDRQVRRANYDLRKANSEKIQADLVHNRRSKIERDNIVQSYEARMRDLEGQVQGSQEQSRELTRRRIGDMADKSEKLLRETNRRNRGDQDLQQSKYREDRARLIAEGEAKVNRAEERADTIVNRVKKATNDSQVVQSKYYQTNLEQLKDSYAEQLGAQREAHLDSLAKIRMGMEAKMRSQDAKAQARTEALVQNYEAKIKAMDEQHVAELKRIKDASDSRIEQRDKNHRFETEAVAQKYEVRLSQQAESHQKEIERVQKRHEETMADIGNRMSYLKKKA